MLITCLFYKKKTIKEKYVEGWWQYWNRGYDGNCKRGFSVYVGMNFLLGKRLLYPTECGNEGVKSVASALFV